PGHWRGGRCLCEDDGVFSPARGGCVAPFEGSTETLAKICTSSLNEGHWDTDRERCQCPTGRIWFAETCPVQGDLSSREVCESAYNGGTWDKGEKSCVCKLGQVWIDQT